MKKLFNIILIFILFLFIPFIVEAATISLDESSSSGNITTIKIKYNPESSEPGGELKINVGTTNTDSKLIYSLKKSSVVAGSCDLNNLDCTLNVDSTSSIDVAELTIVNSSAEETAGATITVKSTLNSVALADVSKTIQIKKQSEQVTEPTKSSDPSITSMKISVGTFDKTFNKSTFEYLVTGIKDTVKTITFTPECDNCDVTITCPNGDCEVLSKYKVELEVGPNQISINSVSEDKTSDVTYTFTVYRGEVEKPSAYLSDLSIEDVIISPKFDVLNNDYTATIGGDIEELVINAIPEDPKASVEIKGNKKLEIGENTITITVTSSDKESKQVYTILVTKEEEKEEEKTTTKKIVTTGVKKKDNKNKYLIIGAAVLGLIIIIVAFIIIFKKKNKKNNNNKPKSNFEKKKEDVEITRDDIERVNTDQLRILEATKRELSDGPKQDVDEALDDLMKTKKLELGDLDDYI